MIDFLELVGMICGVIAAVALGSMVVVLLGSIFMAMIFDSLRWAHERREALREHHADMRRERVRQSSLREQLSTSQAEVQRLEYENQELRRRMVAAGQKLPEPDKNLSVVRGDEPFLVHGVIEDRRR